MGGCPFDGLLSIFTSCGGRVHHADRRRVFCIYRPVYRRSPSHELKSCIGTRRIDGQYLQICYPPICLYGVVKYNRIAFAHIWRKLGFGYGARIEVVKNPKICRIAGIHHLKRNFRLSYWLANACRLTHCHRCPKKEAKGEAEFCRHHKNRLSADSFRCRQCRVCQPPSRHAMLIFPCEVCMKSWTVNAQT